MTASALLTLLLPEISATVLAMLRILGDRELTPQEVDQILEANRAEREVIYDRIRARIAAQS